MILKSLSKLCFGCEALGGTDWGNINLRDIEDAISIATERGVNFFDTADVYGLGNSEKRLSSILGEKRHEIFIATKGGVRWNKQDSVRAKITFDSSPEYISSAVDDSLKRLRLDTLPLYYIHWPDPTTPIESTLECITELKNQKKILYFGLSNISESELIEATRFTDIDFVQIPLNLMTKEPSKKFISTCKKHKIKIIGYNVLNMGLLTGKFDYNSKFGNNDRRSRLPEFNGDKFKENLRKIEEISKEALSHNKSLTHYSIDQVVRRNYVKSVILGIKNKKQILENLDYF